MVTNEAIGREERAYLRAVYELAGGQAKTAVSFREIQEYIPCSDDESERCCDFWTRRGALEWTALGHLGLTHLGLLIMKHINNGNGHFSEDHAPADIQTEKPVDGVTAAAGSVSVIIPVLNEAKTIARLVRFIRRSRYVREVLAVDDGSIDSTAEEARRAGAIVMTSSLLGKGASMEDGLRAATGDVVLFLDGDLLEVCDDLIERMTGPIHSGEADLVKARFTRDSGRVTVLTARPLLSAFFPELAGFAQPLGGIVAARRSLLSDLRLENDYGVDVALLLDAAARGARLAEVDIGHIDHESQPLEALGEMAKQVTRVILDRAWRYERLSINQVLEMQEAERRARAHALPPLAPTLAAPRFALFDMDGTLLEGRFVVELAERVGVEAELARLLDSALLPDDERSRAIASLFIGVPREVFEDVARSIPLVAGAVEILVALRRAGYRVGIVTDSFHVAAETVRRRVFADFTVAHVMRFHNGEATGELTLSPAMIDAHGCRRHTCCKSNVMRCLSSTAGLRRRTTLAVGDGENDICMLRAAGISVAFRPRSKKVERAAKYRLDGSLTGILDLLEQERTPFLRKSSSLRLPSLPLSPQLAKEAG